MTPESDSVLLVLTLILALVVGFAMGAHVTALKAAQAARVECGNQVPGR